MGSQEGGSISNGMTQTRTHTQTRELMSNPIARQGSLYGLTFDEVQNQLGDLGKPLGSMNLDELLKTVCTVDANNETVGGIENDQPVPHPLSDQQSDVVLLADLSKRTVDEVWQDIQHGQKMSCLDRKVTLGEITLEDFLVKAGVVAESKRDPGPPGWTNDRMRLPHQAQWINYHQILPPVFMPGHHSVRQTINAGGNPSMDCGNYSETQMTLSSSDTQTPGRKRVAPPGDIAEKSIERRQKRMIKNRESAARSRARKQAYTYELENKVSRLEEENKRLKRRKESEKILASIPPPQPTYQLRRTSSAPM
ncbi:ABSCISIC ACID-INSENSITIVE 5-like protein 2 [Orobanche gracilis]